MIIMDASNEILGAIVHLKNMQQLNTLVLLREQIFNYFTKNGNDFFLTLLFALWLEGIILDLSIDV